MTRKPLRSVRAAAPAPASLRAAPATTPAANAAADMPGEWISLDGFTMQRQCHTKWCWAAVAEAVTRFYGSTQYTQLAIAMMLMPELDPSELNVTCYKDARLEERKNLPCNKDELLMSALLLTDCFDHPYSIPDRPPPLEDVHNWISGNERGRRAVCVRIRWPSGKAHFVAITGYRPGTRFLLVWDPWGPEYRVMTYDELAHNYTSLDGGLADTHSVGKWVDTHYTKRPLEVKARALL